jgi:hypothetical protein
MWPRIVANDTTLSDFQKVKADLKELQQRSLVLQRKRLAGYLGDGWPLGLVPRICMQKEDQCEIAILHGSKFPVVIEEMGEGTDGWKIIGQCYLEVAIYGDLVDWWGGGRGRYFYDCLKKKDASLPHKRHSGILSSWA